MIRKGFLFGIFKVLVLLIGIICIFTGCGGGGGKNNESVPSEGNGTNNNLDLTILSPLNNAIFTQGDSITFESTAFDPEDGFLSGDSVLWTSSINGIFGIGTSLINSKLSLGIHTITLTMADSDGNITSISVVITIREIEIVWEKIYGGIGINKAQSIQQTTDGGYIVAGYTYISDTEELNMRVLKLNINGNKEWEKIYGDSVAYSVQQTSDSGYVVAGYTISSYTNTEDFYIIKLNAKGDKVWEKTYGEDSDEYIYSIQQTSDSGYIVAGNIWATNLGSSIYIIKLDTNGNKEWEKSYGEHQANSVQQTTDGGYIIAGAGRSNIDSRGVYIIKLDTNGNKEWEKIYGGDEPDEAFAIQQTTDGGYIVAGTTQSFGAEDNNLYIIKLRPDGNKDWEKSYDGNKSDKAEDIKQTLDGGYIIGGYTNRGPTGLSEIYVVKLDATGDQVWGETYGQGIAYSIQQTSDGGYIVAGNTPSSSGASDIYILKLL